MKQKLLSVLLILSIVLALAPVSVFAADGEAVATIDDAKDSSTANSIKLIKDVNLETTYTVSSGAVVLDLNGHKVTAPQGKQAIKVAAGGTLEIKDTSTSRAGEITRPEHSRAYVILNNGNLTISGGTVSSPDETVTTIRNRTAAAANAAPAKLTIRGGSVTGDYIAIGNDCENSSNLNKPELIIEGGFVGSGKDQVIQNFGKATIQGGTFSGCVATWSDGTENGETEITGGTFNLNGSRITPPAVIGVFLYEEGHEASLKISGNVNVNGSLNDSDVPTVAVAIGGSGTTQPLNRVPENVAVEINGGTYSNNPFATSNIPTAGYEVTLVDGKYQVAPEVPAVPTAPTLSFTIPNDSEDLLGKHVSDLLTGGSVTAGTDAGSDGKIPVTVTGTATAITGYTQFNENDTSEQSGYYLPLKITPSEAGCNVTVTGSKGDKTFNNWPAAGDTLIMRLDGLQDKEYKFEVKVETEEQGTATYTTYTVDCSGVIPRAAEPEEPEAEEYTITFDGNGGSVTPSTATTTDGKLSSLPTPTRDGYQFGGWFTAASGGESVTTDTAFTENATIYAHWTADSNDPGSTGDGVTYEIWVRSDIRHGSVDVSHWRAEPGTRVTITVDPETDYMVDWVEAVRESNGYSLFLSQSGRRYTFTMPASDVTIDARFRLQYYSYTYYQPVEPVQPAVFTPVFTPVARRYAAVMQDVPVYSWAYSPAQWAYQNGYLDLEADGSFQLNETVPHQQMWKIMAKWLGEPGMNDRELTNWAMQNGAAKGSLAAGAMTRQDVVMYLYQCCFLMGGDVSTSGNLISYPDSRLITSIPAQNAWTWAVNKGIISGTADGYLNPNNTVSRGEFATILMRLCQNT